ncbi:MAG: hypothetical protein R3296_14925, partial [Oleiphilaceae bacterium]|nr:hypothetical protein [Oleiphilaceae bacterium]
MNAPDTQQAPGERAKPTLSERAFWSLINAVERRLFSDNFIVSNRTPFEVIHSERIMSVRHYLPLEEDEIQVADQWLSVNRQRHRTPVVGGAPRAAPPPIVEPPAPRAPGGGEGGRG